MDSELQTGKVTGDDTPPAIKSVMGSANDLQDIIVVYFDEAIKKASAETIENLKPLHKRSMQGFL